MPNNLNMTSFRINELEYKYNTNNVKVGTKFQIKPKIECKLGRNDKVIFVNLSTRINEDISSPVPFNLNVVMFATFQLVSKEEDQNVLAKEAFDILYPYLRAAISAITVNCNIPAYVLPVINPNQLQQQGEVMLPQNNGSELN